jgi:hypothetical protein
MTLKGWSLSTCLTGWLLLALSFVLTRVFETDQWSVVVPLTVHLFAYLVLAAAAVLSVLWMLALARWQEDMAVAIINLLLASAPVVYLIWTYSRQDRPLTKFVLYLMWTGQ